MREIELKFKVENPKNVISFLERNNCHLSDINSQNDTIYVQNLDNVESTEGSVWLRVRKSNDRVELNYKKQSAKLSESEEIEFEVSSYEKANLFLEALGFKKWVEVNKKRQYTKYQDYNICLDEVEHLGTFVEIEVLVSEQNETDYEEKILEVAKIMGINPDNRINSHYDTMISKLKKD